MADSRIRGLASEVVVNEIASLLNTLYLAVDDASFTEAKKILLKTILTEAVVDARTNNYQALTPKGFYDSIMTTARRGIGRLATDVEVIGKSETGLLNSLHQVLMQEQWRKDFFVRNGSTPGGFVANTSDLATAKALQFPFVYNGTIDGGGILVGPSLPNSVYYAYVYFTYLISYAGVYSRGTLALQAGSLGVETQVALGNGFSLDLYDGGSIMVLFSTNGTKNNVYASFSFNAVMK